MQVLSSQERVRNAVLPPAGMRVQLPELEEWRTLTFVVFVNESCLDVVNTEHDCALRCEQVMFFIHSLYLFFKLKDTRKVLRIVPLIIGDIHKTRQMKGLKGTVEEKIKLLYDYCPESWLFTVTVIHRF